MKNSRIIVALILVAAITVGFAACTGKPVSGDNTESQTVTVAQTDKNGKEVTVAVTDESGKEVTDKDGKTVTEVATEVKVLAPTEEASVKVDLSEKESAAKEKAKKKKKKSTTAKNESTSAEDKTEKGETTKAKKETTTKKAKESTTAATTKATQPATKVKNPNTVKEIKVTDITESGLKLSWEGVICDFYELEYKRADVDEWETVDDSLKAESIELTGLDSYTDYSFRIRAIIKSKAGKSESNWTYADAKTAAQELNRKIKIEVLLPTRLNQKDTLVLYIKEKGKKRVKLVKEKLELDGSTYTFETKDKYTGVVTIQAKLVNAEAIRNEKTDNEECKIDISKIGIDTVEGEDD